MQIINKRSFKLILGAWVAVWLVFILRENKPGQHADLKYLYNHSSYDDKISYVLGGDLHSFLTFSKSAIPEGATYKIYGLEQQDFKEIQARYFLWPLRTASVDPDFMIIYRSEIKPIENYSIFEKYKDLGFILTKTSKK